MTNRIIKRKNLFVRIGDKPCIPNVQKTKSLFHSRETSVNEQSKGFGISTLGSELRNKQQGEGTEEI